MGTKIAMATTAVAQLNFRDTIKVVGFSLQAAVFCSTLCTLAALHRPNIHSQGFNIKSLDHDGFKTKRVGTLGVRKTIRPYW